MRRACERYSSNQLHRALPRPRGAVFDVPRRDLAQIGVFGGSGLYQLLEDVEEVKVATPYGPPSDNVMLGQVEGVKVAFLPRHGRGHRIPPHRINYRANVW